MDVRDKAGVRRRVQNNNKLTDQVVETVCADDGQACSACIIVRRETPGSPSGPMIAIPAMESHLPLQSANDLAFVFCLPHGNAPGDNAGLRRNGCLCLGSACAAGLLKIQGLPFRDARCTNARQ